MSLFASLAFKVLIIILYSFKNTHVLIVVLSKRTVTKTQQNWNP